MSWLNTNYILRAGVLSVLLLLPGLMSATCKRDQSGLRVACHTEAHQTYPLR